MAYYTAVTTIVTPLEKMVAQACSAQHSKIRTHVEKTGVKCCVGFEVAVIVYRSSEAIASSAGGLGHVPLVPSPQHFQGNFLPWFYLACLDACESRLKCTVIILIHGVACHQSISRPHNAYITQFQTDYVFLVPLNFTHSTVPCVM